MNSDELHVLADRDQASQTAPVLTTPGMDIADKAGATAGKITARPVSTAAKPAIAPSRPKKAAPKVWRPSIFPQAGPPLPPEFAGAVRQLEADLKLPVWLFVLGGREDEIEPRVVNAFIANFDDLPETPIALLVHSSGGHAVSSFQLARLLRRRCGGFTAVIPRRAKSAATLLSLGADQIIMGQHGELGPLDVQIEDPSREEIGSALDEVQALERLNAYSMQVFDALMFLFLDRTKKKIEFLMPLVLHHVAELMRPLLEKLDTVHFTQMSRELKVAEEYGIRLLLPRFGRERSQQIASHLVEHFPEHRFPIYIEEANAEPLFLGVTAATESQDKALQLMLKHLPGMTAVGRIKEVTS